MQNRRVITTLLTLALPSLAAGQAVAPLELNLQPFDQRVADVGLLSADLRIIQPTLELPTSFEDIYRVPGRPEDLASIQGGLIAIFPQSQAIAVRTQFGVVPDVPPGTVFYIGQPPASAVSGSARELPGDVLRLNTRMADTRVSTRDEPTPPADIDTVAGDSQSDSDAETDRPQRINRDVPPAIRNDAEYRNRRIRELLREAERASREP